MDGIKSPRSTIQAPWKENIFGRVWTHFRVQIGLFLVQKCPFGPICPKDVENLCKKYTKVDNTRSPGSTVQARWDENYYWKCLDPFKGPYRPIFGPKIVVLYSKYHRGLLHTKCTEWAGSHWKQLIASISPTQRKRIELELKRAQV